MSWEKLQNRRNSQSEFVPSMRGRNTCYFSNMRLKQYSYASAPGKLPSKKARISRERQSSTSGASALRVFLRVKLQEFGKMRKQVIAVAAAIVLGLATTATGTTALARGGGGGGGGHGGGFGGGGHGGGFGARSRL